MRKLKMLLLLSLVCFLLMPAYTVYARGDEDNPDTHSPPHQEVVPDTVKDPRSKYTAKYLSATGHVCTAILISSTAALTAQHCGGTKARTRAGTIYPGASGTSTPFGYMNIRFYIPHPTKDIALIKGIDRDQDKFYKYYIGKFKTTVTGYTDEALSKFVEEDIYSYGYPYKEGVFKQYRSDGTITNYSKYLPLFYTNMPASEGQSGSGVFTKNGNFIGIITTRTHDKEADVLPFTTDIADWINTHAN
ncbi:serine protease [Staphylococcus delphini]|uniref:Serine protease n=1 Tax=Staphylococcus delphini TaxID=53344 RepID=A0A2A4GVQ3_9STAP|nr:serine protease [Staphylococcus delphini]PCF54329.1 serine protease [Staphylococcus delphini]PCF61192.1 serine protease [Staphylococcus delphini]PCF74017.1 serine protease [Staphylococcus delphini]HEC2158442.1 trypsin-like peptidase domain-containing protein [Staphylococcus delphini]